jgi:MFS family permease
LPDFVLQAPHLHLTYTQIGVISGISQAGFLVASLSSGFLAASLGAGILIITSVLTCGLCLVGLTVTSNIYLLALNLTVLRACSAMAWVPMVAVVGRLIAFEQRSKVLGLLSSGTSYGVFVNGILVPYFIVNFHWRDIWLVTGLGTLALMGVSLFFLRAAGVLNDLPVNPRRDWRHRQTIGVRFTPMVWILLVIFFLSGLAYIPFQTYLSPFLRDDRGLNVALVGNVWSLIGLVGMGAGFIMGLLSDRIGIRPVMALTYLLTLLAAGLLCFSVDPFWPCMAGVAFGLAFYALFGLTPAYIAKIFAPDQAAMFFGVANVFMGAGCMIGNFLGGWSNALSGTLTWVYVAVGAIALILIPLTYLLPDERPHPMEKALFATMPS